MMARWKVFDDEKAPQCTHCGMWAPFARYRRKTGQNARYLTDYCPYCGARMTGMDECFTCPYAEDRRWQENGICYACREDPWVYGKKQNERILEINHDGR